MTNSFRQPGIQFCLTDKELQNEMRTLSFDNVSPLVRISRSISSVIYKPAGSGI
ncbi:hypothetical protein [Methanospirillum lacunae]|uniref:hypothetical protein n=1 Tax=Methanospirillum lacunae TaxID=668570 RepID=UPI0038FCAC3E